MKLLFAKALPYLGNSWLTHHPKQSQETQDEARFGKQNTMAGLSASKGSCPPSVVKIKRRFTSEVRRSQSQQGSKLFYLESYSHCEPCV